MPKLVHTTKSHTEGQNWEGILPREFCWRLAQRRCPLISYELEAKHKRLKSHVYLIGRVTNNPGFWKAINLDSRLTLHRSLAQEFGRVAEFFLDAQQLVVLGHAVGAAG